MMKSKVALEGAVDEEGNVHSKTCTLRTYEICWDEECDFCGVCSCGGVCGGCGSFFWLEKDSWKWGEMSDEERENLRCRWCKRLQKAAEEVIGA